MDNIIIKTRKIRLKPTREQYRLLHWYSLVARRFWNLIVYLDRKINSGEYQKEIVLLNLKKNFKKYKTNENTLQMNGYVKLVKYLANQDKEKYNWFLLPNQSKIYELVEREFLQVKNRNKGVVKFRSIKKYDLQFPIICGEKKPRLSRIYQIHKNEIQIPTLGHVKTGDLQGYDLDCKKQTSHIRFDGKYWYLHYTEKIKTAGDDKEKTDGIGIDLGIKELATCSDKTVIPNVKKLRRYRILNKQLKIVQRELSRKYLINNYKKTKNIIKLEKKLRLICRKIKNLRLNYIKEFVSKIIKKNPRFVALENLNIKGMLKNKHLAKVIQECSWFTIKILFIQKGKEFDIPIRNINRFYPSSKTCWKCKAVKKELKLKERIFKCFNCGYITDRDFNASLNIRDTKDYILI